MGVRFSPKPQTLQGVEIVDGFVGLELTVLCSTVVLDRVHTGRSPKDHLSIQISQLVLSSGIPSPHTIQGLFLNYPELREDPKIDPLKGASLRYPLLVPLAV